MASAPRDKRSVRRLRKARGLILLLVGVGCAVVSVNSGYSSEAFGTVCGTRHFRTTRSGVGVDPQMVSRMQQEISKMMVEPQNMKMFEQFSDQMQSMAKSLENDVEMKSVFEDIQRNGLDAMKRYALNASILSKFSKAMAGLNDVPGFSRILSSIQPTMVSTTFKPGDNVIIVGLADSSELNGQIAWVMEPTDKEKKTLEGTTRHIVRLMERDERFAVKSENLRAIAEDVEDILSDPTLRTEAEKLRESGRLDAIQNDPMLKPIFDDISRNGMPALEKYWNDAELMKRINDAVAR